MENIFLHKKSFYLQGILDDINEQDTSVRPLHWKLPLHWKYGGDFMGKDTW